MTEKKAVSAEVPKETPVLKAVHLGISFGGLKAVDDFNMEIGRSELVGLIGPNGAGKTTVFNLLTGVYKPTEGAFYLNGKKMNGRKTYQVVDEGIARTFQNIRLFKKMTVLENVKVAMNKDMQYSPLASIFRTNSYWREEHDTDERAMELRKLFTDRGIKLHIDSPTNQQFFLMENKLIHKLSENVRFEMWGPEREEATPVRFVTSWATTEAQILELEEYLDEALKSTKQNEK